jgi:glycosyltransferase involved in cell wall biosynthesis
MKVIENDMANPSEAVCRALAQGPYDLVHVHPFQARSIGLEVAARCAAKVAFTIHGQYLDAVGDEMDAIIAVSDRVADYLKPHLPHEERLHVIPNAVDFDVFKPTLLPCLKRKLRRRRVVTVCSRIDSDKTVLLRCIRDAVQALAKSAAPSELRIQGEHFFGDIGDFFEDIASVARGTPLRIVPQSWTSDRNRLRAAFEDSDIVIASGRGAAESVGCLRPTIAVGSRGYVGLIDRNSIGLAMATNFGSCLEPSTQYSPERLNADLNRGMSLHVDEVKACRQALMGKNDLREVDIKQVRLADELIASKLAK